MHHWTSGRPHRNRILASQFKFNLMDLPTKHFQSKVNHSYFTCPFGHAIYLPINSHTHTGITEKIHHNSRYNIMPTHTICLHVVYIYTHINTHISRFTYIYIYLYHYTQIPTYINTVDCRHNAVSFITILTPRIRIACGFSWSNMNSQQAPHVPNLQASHGTSTWT